MTVVNCTERNALCGYPNALVSPAFRTLSNTQWVLLRSHHSVTLPRWARSAVGRALMPMLSRSIAYLDSEGHVLGLATAWIPIHHLGVRLFVRSFWLFGPRRLIGESIKELLGDAIRIQVLLHSRVDDVLTPYRSSPDRIAHTRRLIWSTASKSEERLLAIVEERFTEAFMTMLGCPATAAASKAGHDED